MPRIANVRARASVSLAVVFVFGAMLAGCGSGEESRNAPAETAKQAAPAETAEATAPAASPEEETRAADEGSTRTATVRIAGSEGTVYAGNYGNLDVSEYAEGRFEAEPVEFTVDLRESGFDIVNASFVKPNGDDGTLRIEILSGGEVVAEQDAETQYGALNLTWSSEG